MSAQDFVKTWLNNQNVLICFSIISFLLNLNWKVGLIDSEPACFLFFFFLFCAGGIWDVLHNSYVKGTLALGALLGPGRGLCLAYIHL